MAALRASLNPLETTLDCDIDRLIIAHFEMQEALLLSAPPIAPVQRILPDEMQRARDWRIVLIGQAQHHPIGHTLAQQIKRFAREVWRAPFARAGILIENPEYVPMLRLDVIACQSDNLQALLCTFAFLSERSAFA